MERSPKSPMAAQPLPGRRVRSPSTITQWLNSNPEPNYTTGYLGPTMQAQCNEALGDLGASVAQVTNFRTVVYFYKNGVPQFAIVSPYWIFKGTSCGL